MSFDDDAPGWKPSDGLMALWPGQSGNTINGLGETRPRRPTPVFWRPDGSVAHAPIQSYFYEYDKDNERIAAARLIRQQTAAIPESDIAPEPVQMPPAQWAATVKALALELGADDVGICEYRPEWTFDDREPPRGRWIIMVAFGQDYQTMARAPHEDAYIEVMKQYARAGNTAKYLANAIRERGYYAAAKTGPNTEDVLMIPAALQSGLGELGKHGSIIHPRLGSNFRLSAVMTDAPLLSDAPVEFGADDFCTRCQVCTRECPPDAIAQEKQMVRGELKWYVDFDKCIPYFIENKTCGICLAVCPWSRPGVADGLVAKLARRRARQAGEATDSEAAAP